MSPYCHSLPSFLLSPLSFPVADLNSADEEGRTALHVACWQGHLEVVASLLDSGADPNSEDNEGRTALQSAAWQGHSDVVQLLCERGANVNHMCGQGMV